MQKEIDNFVKGRKGFKAKKLAQDEFKLMADFQNVAVDDLGRKNEGIGYEMNNMKVNGGYISTEATERNEWLTCKQKIYVCGGFDGEFILNSVDSFSLPENSWKQEPAMNVPRSTFAAFVYQGQINATGGWDGSEYTNSIERFRVCESDTEWVGSFVKIPIKCNGHGIVCRENTVILTGGRDGDIVSDRIHEIKLIPPYTTNLLTRLPERRCYHGFQIIGNEVIVAGGRTSTCIEDAKNTVYAYNIKNNECRTLSPLPYPVAAMATLCYKGNVILIGGHNEKDETLNTVFMYEVKTGKIKMLPCLNHKREGSAAVITGNMIIVMGGYDYESDTFLNSVECLNLSSDNEWKELSLMTKKRGFATAVLVN
ncbi:kelch-like protein 4 [Dendronephthya gigantea]|uniref:kelch-like protein 4 n=1 Tax=Dendronephthya gigantea TaxID=151771 RepID=UPI00106C3739|nr:kelch-like protein 4 [Dendronephthya gigantea]